MRYYSTQRPNAPGTFPRQGGTETVTNFDSKIYCEEIGREAWGYVEYKEPITPEQARDYELTPGGTEGRVLVGTDESGRQVAFVGVLNCHGCKWLDRYKKDGNGYCCMVAEKVRRPEMERCKRYEAGDFKTRWETERAKRAEQEA